MWLTEYSYGNKTSQLVWLQPSNMLTLLGIYLSSNPALRNVLCTVNCTYVGSVGQVRHDPVTMAIGTSSLSHQLTDSQIGRDGDARPAGRTDGRGRARANGWIRWMDVRKDGYQSHHKRTTRRDDAVKCRFWHFALPSNLHSLRV